jgi:hypothetical protein
MNNQDLNENGNAENSQIELQLSEQDNKLQDIIEILQIILVYLNDKSANQEDQEQILLIKHALVSLDSNMKKGNTLHKDSETSTQQSLNKIKQESQDLRAYCQQINQQLKKQNAILEEHFSLKGIAFQYLAIAILAAVTTVIGIRLFPR